MAAANAVMPEEELLVLTINLTDDFDYLDLIVDEEDLTEITDERCGNMYSIVCLKVRTTLTVNRVLPKNCQIMFNIQDVNKIKFLLSWGLFNYFIVRLTIP